MIHGLGEVATRHGVGTLLLGVDTVGVAAPQPTMAAAAAVVVAATAVAWVGGCPVAAVRSSARSALFVVARVAKSAATGGYVSLSAPRRWRWERVWR